MILAESEQDKYGTNLADIAAGYGISVDHGTVQDYQQHHQAPSWVSSELLAGHPVLSDVDELVFYRAGSLTHLTASHRPGNDSAPRPHPRRPRCSRSRPRVTAASS